MTEYEMSIREMTEYAGNAIGLDPMWEDELGQYLGFNPANSNDDSMHLATELGISVQHYPLYNREKHSVYVSRKHRLECREDGKWLHGPEIVVPYGSDKQAATRMAVLYVAALIWKETS